MADFQVRNETTGLLHPVAPDVYLAHMAWSEAKAAFEFYAEHKHNSTSLLSAMVHQDLMKTMDAAYKRFRPFQNAWCIAKKGYSLN